MVRWMDVAGRVEGVEMGEMQIKVEVKEVIGEAAHVVYVFVCIWCRVHGLYIQSLAGLKGYSQ